MNANKREIERFPHNLRNKTKLNIKENIANKWQKSIK